MHSLLDSCLNKWLGRVLMIIISLQDRKQGAQLLGKYLWEEVPAPPQPRAGGVLPAVEVELRLAQTAQIPLGFFRSSRRAA